MEFLYVLVTSAASYKFWNLLTHPNSKIWRKFPTLKVKRLQLFPSIRIFIKGRIFHLHHWMSLSMLLCVSVFVTSGILDSWITRGALIGGVVQGLSIPEARKIIYK